MKNKKAQFDVIKTGMIGFIGFVLIIILTIVMISIMKSSTLVCSDPDGIPTRSVSGMCQACPSTAWVFNTTGNFCCNATGGTTHCLGANQTAIVDYGGAAYNATKYLSDAAILPPQFASLIVIVVIIIGILGLLALLGYNVYKKIKE